VAELNRKGGGRKGKPVGGYVLADREGPSCRVERGRRGEKSFEGGASRAKMVLREKRGTAPTKEGATSQVRRTKEWALPPQRKGRGITFLQKEKGGETGVHLRWRGGRSGSP